MCVFFLRECWTCFVIFGVRLRVLRDERYFAGDIFQPVPYSATTPQGMPMEIEDKYFLKEEVNVNQP